MRERQQDIKRGKEMVGIMINIPKLLSYLYLQTPQGLKGSRIRERQQDIKRGREIDGKREGDTNMETYGGMMMNMSKLVAYTLKRL